MKQYKIVKVWIPLALDKAYSYLVPSEKEEDFVKKGHRLGAGVFVKVPFAGRKLIGIIGDIVPFHKNTVSLDKLKSVEELYDLEPMPKADIEFLSFFSHYTLTPFGLVLRMALRGAGQLASAKPVIGFVLAKNDYQPKTAAAGRVIRAFLQQKFWTQKHLCEAAKVSASVLKTLQKHGVITKFSMPEGHYFEEATGSPHLILLEGQQKQAAETLCGMVQEQKHHVALLDGVTGSGKTEVYFHAIAEALSLDKQVLILLPEIALTQQFLDRFFQQFKFYPVEWHSGLTTKQREKIWRNVKNGHTKIVAGARSALFLPFSKIGLIIVDEEHDQSFKQEENVFYNARDMAVARAYYNQIPVVLASATPSLESYHNALEGKYLFVPLTQRYQKAKLPEIKLVDCPTKEPYISKELQLALQENLAKGQQSLLFLNRRGYAPFTICRHCGYKLRCHQCSSYLVLHRFEGVYRCHQCEESEPFSPYCPHCHDKAELVHNFAGVERIYEILLQLYPKARLLILSSDLLTSLRKVRQAFAKIEAGEVDLVIGTQMITKGHHFPKLTLVGVLDADFSLKNGDFRAPERLFQLLSQVTGRAGRSGNKSFGYIQTNYPQQPLLEAICHYKRDKFYQLELEQRKKSGYPPFGRMAALIISGKDAQICQNYARHLRQIASETPEIKIYGPAEAEMFLIRGRYRYRLLIKAKRQANIQGYIRDLCQRAAPLKGDVKLQIDIDPQSFF